MPKRCVQSPLYRKDIICPICKEDFVAKTRLVLKNTPVNINVFYNKRKDAIGVTRSDINLVQCDRCSFIFNCTFDPKLIKFTENFSSSQSASGEFAIFKSEVIKKILHFKSSRIRLILEVGCGDGDFLNEICTASESPGIGYDPSFPANKHLLESIKIYKKSFSGRERVSSQADILLCRMVLEHQESPVGFLLEITNNLSDNCLVVIEVPNLKKTISCNRFHDFYYDHCNYFTEETLRYCIRHAGMKVIQSFEAFDSNNLIVFCHKSKRRDKGHPPQKRSAPQVLLSHLSRNYKRYLQSKSQLLKNALKGSSISLWGASAKGQTICNTFNLTYDKVPYLLDNNRLLWNKYVIGTGNIIFSPQRLMSISPPDMIFFMNNTYKDEIKKQLKSMNVDCQLKLL